MINLKHSNLNLNLRNFLEGGRRCALGEKAVGDGSRCWYLRLSLIFMLDSNISQVRTTGSFSPLNQEAGLTRYEELEKEY